MNRVVFVYVLWLLLCTGCVSLKKFKQLEGELLASRQQNEQCGRQLLLLGSSRDSLDQRLSEKADALADKTLKLNERDQQYRQLQSSYEALQADVNSETEKYQQQKRLLLKDIASRDSLIKKNDELITLLNTRLSNCEQQQSRQQDKRQERYARLELLQIQLSKKLDNFEGSEFSIRPGEEQVRLCFAESLLFKPASAQLDENGMEVLLVLLSILQERPDLKLALNTRVPLSNDLATAPLDLYSLRSAAVARFLLLHGLAPTQLHWQGQLTGQEPDGISGMEIGVY